MSTAQAARLLIDAPRGSFVVSGNRRRRGRRGRLRHGTHIGTLTVGKAVDLALIDRDKLAYPYLDPETSVLGAVIQRAKSEAVDLVVVAGEVVYEGGRFIRVDRDAALRELHQSLQRALADDEIERRQLSKALLPHVRRFYANYVDPEAHLPLLPPELADLTEPCGQLRSSAGVLVGGRR